MIDISKLKVLLPEVLHDCFDVGRVVQDHLVVSAKLTCDHPFANAFMFKKVRRLPVLDDLIIQPEFCVLRNHAKLVHIHAHQSLHLIQSSSLIFELLLKVLDHLVLFSHVVGICNDLGLYLNKLLVSHHHGILCVHLEVLTVRSDQLCIGCQSL